MAGGGSPCEQEPHNRDGGRCWLALWEAGRVTKGVPILVAVVSMAAAAASDPARHGEAATRPPGLGRTLPPFYLVPPPVAPAQVRAWRK